MSLYYVRASVYVHLCMYLTHLMNKQMSFFDKNVLVEPEFYNYLNTLW